MSGTRFIGIYFRASPVERRPAGLGRVSFLGSRFLVQPIDCFLSLRGGGEDRPFVIFEGLQPRADVWGVILSWVGREAKFGAQKSRSKFGHKLLHRIGCRAKPARHFSV